MGTLGGNLRYLREQHGLSLDDVERDLHISKYVLTMYENNERTPNMKFLIKFLKYYNSSLSFLYGAEPSLIPPLEQRELCCETCEIHIEEIIDKVVDFLKTSGNLYLSKEPTTSEDINLLVKGITESVEYAKLYKKHTKL